MKTLSDQFAEILNRPDDTFKETMGAVALVLMVLWLVVVAIIAGS